MKKIKRYLSFLEYKGVDLDDFYCITLYPGNLVLQGHYSSLKVNRYAKLFNGKFEASTNGYLEFKNHRITIVLTD